jgi:glycosyltransferase involved in cell wall biosynthesis
MLRDLKAVIKKYNFDIIHTHLNPADFYVNLVRPKRIPQVHTVHIAYSTDTDTRPINILLERKLYFEKKYANLIFLSEFTKQDFLDSVKFKGRSFVLNNFVDDAFFQHQPKKFTGSAGRGLRIIAVGNFRPQKNYAYLLDIFKHLKEHSIHVDIYGGGGDIEKCRELITENKLNITLKGPVTNVNELISGYDLFIMPSSNEGFPLSVFEAMAAGVPLMLSHIKPLTSIVKEHAVYFELDDAEKAAGQLIAILRNEIDISSMAVKAQLYAQQTVKRDIYIKTLLNIYNQLKN